MARLTLKRKPHPAPVDLRIMRHRNGIFEQGDGVDVNTKDPLWGSTQITSRRSDLVQWRYPTNA